jgi:hypothetical protein
MDAERNPADKRRENMLIRNTVDDAARSSNRETQRSLADRLAE